MFDVHVAGMFSIVAKLCLWLMYNFEYIAVKDILRYLTAGAREMTLTRIIMNITQVPKMNSKNV